MKVQSRIFENKIPHIKPGMVYDVIGLNWEMYRIIDEGKMPALYPKEYFDVIDPAIPNEWIWKRFEGNTYYADPPELAEPGFFERWYEHEESARKIFDEYLIKNNLK